MSRFFKARGGSDSDTDSTDSEIEDEPKVTKKNNYGTDDLDFAAGGEDDEKRVVRAQKDKKFDELKGIIKQNRDAKSNKDLNKLLTGFDTLTKAFEKSKAVFQRQNIGVPRFFIRSIVEIENYANKLWDDKEAKSGLSKNNAKALPALRQKVKKYIKELGTPVTDYLANPDEEGYETPEEEEDDIESEDDGVLEKSPEKAVAQAETDDDRDDDVRSTSSWSSEPDTSGSDTDEDGVSKMEQLRRYFLKKEFRGDDKGDKKDKRKQRVIKVKEAVEDDDDDWTPVSREKNVVLFDPKEEVTHDVMIKKLNEVMSVRGKRNTDRDQHVANLRKLLEVSFAIISALFEINVKISDHMDYESFATTLATVNNLLTVLIENENVKLSVTFSDEDENLKDDKEDYRIQGSILIAVQRLDSELAKILQNADCHSNDYIEKLRGEKDMCNLIERAEKYVELRHHLGVFDKYEVCKIYMMRIEHIYYKYKDQCDFEGDVGEMMTYLCNKIYSLDEEKQLRQRAMLCHVYWLAVHDEWHRARDLLLMSHMQAIVDHSDIDTQILYNRTICQLGLCAFRHGFIREAHQGLSEIQNTQRAKELLAQAIGMRQHEKTFEQEKMERSRQVPYHMHINVELMECVYLICSMLLEIPHMASCEFEMRRRMLSRSFHYQLKQSEKASLTGPPENTREHVVAASKAMLNGDWKKCRDYIVNEKMNQKVWNLFYNPEPVKVMVVRRIQEESLRTYLLTYSTVYATVSLTKLSNLFELSKKDVHSIISKMIIQEELSATLDEPTDCLIMHRIEPSRLQMLALNLTGRGGFSGPGAWFPGRNERQGDKQKGTGDRRTGPSDGKRGSNSGGVWGGSGGANQPRRNQKQRAF
ncbi:unnamed protein product [Caenorhabditis angaria]|uniref:Eukaryotic translation initiation factor 3 subunit C n=1 Tax=Caenorhabditis angaria TaxID=860376 RepID=A0A9P1I7M0_9PELO|nr:unnamed protein product [Caenorhabditis angaria]